MVTGVDFGRCLATAKWRDLTLDSCDFEKSDISQGHLLVHDFLEIAKENHRVIFLDDLICDEVSCKTHFDNVFIFRDAGHLSREGSAAVGKRFDFYRMIVEQ